MRRHLDEVVLTPSRYRAGGWDSFLGNLIWFLDEGQRITIRMKCFEGQELTRAYTALMRFLGPVSATSVQTPWELPRRLSFISADDENPEAPLRRQTTDFIVVLEVHDK